MSTMLITAKDSKVTVKVSPNLQRRLEAYDLNPWGTNQVESFPLNQPVDQRPEIERSEISNIRIITDCQVLSEDQLKPDSTFVV